MKTNLLKIMLIAMILLLIGLQSEVFCQTTLVVNSSGGFLNEALNKSYFDNFTKQTGIKVILTSPASFAKMKTMVDAKNVEWDLAELPPRDKVRAIKLGYVEKLDYSYIKNKADLYPYAVHDYAIGFSYYSTIMAYNTKKIPVGKNPKTWAEFWDVKNFPGVRSLRSSPDDNLEIALMADGVPMDKLYPLDIDRAFKKLDQIKPHIKVWWKVGQQPAQLLTDGEVDIATGWHGRFVDIIRKGAPVEMEWNQGILKLSWWGIPKGAKHYKETMQMLAHMMQPPGQVEYLMMTGYPSANKKAMESPDALKMDPKFVPTTPENLKKQVAQSAEWWLDNADKVEDMWQAWIIK